MTIFDFRKHKSCLYLQRLAIHSVCFTAIPAQTLQIRGREGGREGGLFDIADKYGDNLR